MTGRQVNTKGPDLASPPSAPGAQRSPVFLLFLIFCLVGSATAGPPASVLQQAIDQMYEAEPDDSAAVSLTNAILRQRDMQLFLDSGTLTFFKPIRIDSQNLRYGGVFVGRGRLTFQPAISMERQQLRRFLKSDSLDRKFEKLILLFDTATYHQLLQTPGCRPTSPPAHVLDIDTALNKDLQDAKDRHWYYRTLRHLVEPTPEPFLIAVGPVDKSGVLLYISDPNEREQIGLYKRVRRVIYDYIFQTVCSYALEADPHTGDYNGLDKSSLQVEHYDINARIRKSGKLDAVVLLTARVQRPERIFDFYLDPEMKVDSVTTLDGKRITFARYKDSDQYYGLWLMFDAPLKQSDALNLTFHYSGDVAEMELGRYYVFAGATWYPRFGHWQMATFDMRLMSPADYTLIATGDLIDSSTVKDTLFSTWHISEPTANVSFNIGLFKEYAFDGANLTPLQLYFSEDLHRSIASTLGSAMVGTGRHMERQVAEDVQQSMRLYSTLFGPYPHDKIIASEILHIASEAFPAFLHLTFYTWIYTDKWGYNRLHRAHEAAHQWWGAGVGFDSYRDQWLSEGFAEYSAFMYLQHVAGDDRFLDRLDEYRKQIISERKNAGAVGIGIRNLNVQDKDSYMIIVYQRGAYVLHMLRYLMMDLPSMDETRFTAAMQEYYRTYLGTQASTLDFRRVMEKHAGEDLGWFFDQFVYNNYIPTYKCMYRISGGGEHGYAAKIYVKQTDVPVGFRMYLPIEIEYDKGRKVYDRLLIDKPVVELDLTFTEKPKNIRFNPFHAVLAKISQ